MNNSLVPDKCVYGSTARHTDITVNERLFSHVLVPNDGIDPSEKVALTKPYHVHHRRDVSRPVMPWERNDTADDGEEVDDR